jgi:DNA-directed RNA polymerase II subunit RPB1
MSKIEHTTLGQVVSSA